VYAVKKMKWDACEELKILQKVRSFFPLLACSTAVNTQK
jgi:hypothetical protein